MYNHLSSKTALIADLSSEQRKDYCRRNFFIQTDFSKQVIEDVRGMIRMERGGTNVCRALIGKTGIGKSTLINAIVKACNTSDCSPIAVVDLSNYGSRTDLQEIFVSLLGFTEPALKLANPNGTKRIQARIAELALKMIILDEGNALVAATRFAEGNRTFIRAMSNHDIGLNVLIAGTDGVLAFLRKSDTLPSRFGLIEMREWNPEALSFSLFLNGYLRYLPLRKPSLIDTQEIQKLIVDLAGHLTRDIKRVLTDAAIYAIDHGVECLNEKVIKDSYNEALAFYAPDGVIG